MSEHQKNYIFRDINLYVKLVSTLPNFVYALAQIKMHIISQKLPGNMNKEFSKLVEI